MKNGTEVLLCNALQAYLALDFSGAEALCRELLTKDNVNPGAWNLLGKIAASSDSVSAIDYLGTAVELSPINPAFRHDLSRFLLENGESLGAFNHAIEAFNIESANPDYCIGLALAIEGMGDRGSALSLYGHGLTLIMPTSALVAGFGGMLMRDDQLDEALIVLRRAVNIKPVSPDAYYLLAKCCNFQGVYQDGLASAKFAAGLIKAEPLVWCEGALSMIGLNDRQNALIWIEQALILDPSCHQALNIKLLLKVN